MTNNEPSSPLPEDVGSGATSTITNLGGYCGLLDSRKREVPAPELVVKTPYDTWPRLCIVIFTTHNQGRQLTSS